jgi:hypothetical protein
MAKARRTPTGAPSAASQRSEPIEHAFEPAAPQSTGDTTAAAFDRERIAQRAYEIYLARGRADGQDLEDWLTAEREVAPAED